MSDHPLDLLEPGALTDSVATPEIVGGNRVELSIAISLKRIADALSGDKPMNSYGETLGECIQGQHERGLRGIPNP